MKEGEMTSSSPVIRRAARAGLVVVLLCGLGRVRRAEADRGAATADKEIDRSAYRRR